jgi:hypothetical protein
MLKPGALEANADMEIVPLFRIPVPATKDTEPTRPTELKAAVMENPLLIII